jgi:acetoacetate decarboxylase
MSSDTSEPKPVREGWGWPATATKPHYFIDGEALCGRWWFPGELTASTGTTGPKDCKSCARKLAKREAKR